MSYCEVLWGSGKGNLVLLSSSLYLVDWQFLLSSVGSGYSVLTPCGLCPLLMVYSQVLHTEQNKTATCANKDSLGQQKWWCHVNRGAVLFAGMPCSGQVCWKLLPLISLVCTSQRIARFACLMSKQIWMSLLGFSKTTKGFIQLVCPLTFSMTPSSSSCFSFSDPFSLLLSGVWFNLWHWCNTVILSWCNFSWQPFSHPRH